MFYGKLFLDINLHFWRMKGSFFSANCFLPMNVNKARNMKMWDAQVHRKRKFIRLIQKVKLWAECNTWNINHITFIETESAPAPSKKVSTQEREPERPESPPLIPRLPYLPSSRKSLSGTRKTSPSTTKDEQNLSNISQKVSMTKESVSQIAEDMLSSTKEVIHTVMVYFRC